MKKNIPVEVKEVAKVLHGAGFKAYLVGGCVRDMVRGMVPKDWDIATDARPEEIQKLFKTFAGRTEEDPATMYENQFGTVLVKTESEEPSLKIIEITTFRVEGTYTDKRHPDEVRFAETIEDDLLRRDFAINALALLLDEAGNAGVLVDPHNGEGDIAARVIKTVGDPDRRFQEDALRLLRAVRLSAELDFALERNTRDSIQKNAELLEVISKERVRDEFTKLIMSDRAAHGIIMLEELGLLKFILPELREGIGITQNKHHTYTVFEHNVRALDYAVKERCSLEVRVASLLHDAGKPKSKRGEGPDATFHGHEIIGSRMAVRVLDRLRFSKELIEKVAHLVRYHMFYYNVGDVTEAGVRRFLRRVGPENVPDLIKLREADRVGSDVPKAHPYKLRHLLYMIEKVKHDPISPKMLKVDGASVMELTGLTPGPKVGWILSALLDEVLEDPARNTKEYLEARVQALTKLKDDELKKLSERGKETKDEFEREADEEIKRSTKLHENEGYTARVFMLVLRVRPIKKRS